MNTRRGGSSTSSPKNVLHVFCFFYDDYFSVSINIPVSLVIMFFCCCHCWHFFFLWRTSAALSWRVFFIFTRYWPISVIREQCVIVSALSCLKSFMYIHAVFLCSNLSARVKSSLSVNCGHCPQVILQNVSFFFCFLFYGQLIARSPCCCFKRACTLFVVWNA